MPNFAELGAQLSLERDGFLSAHVQQETGLFDAALSQPHEQFDTVTIRARRDDGDPLNIGTLLRHNGTADLCDIIE